MTCTVDTVYKILDAFAPFDTQEDFDNAGLIVGRLDRPVTAILTALDATREVVREARDLGAQLIVTHHPLLFSPLRRLDEADSETAVLCDMIRSGISMIAAHTNLDLAPGGVNDALVARLGWTADEADGFLRLGPLAGLTLADAAEHASRRLNAAIVPYGNPQKPLSRFAVCSGAGGSLAGEAAARGADLLLTGEIRHHEALAAMAQGMAVLACGHRPTEICAAEVLAKHLQSALNELELRVRVAESQVDPFA